MQRGLVEGIPCAPTPVTGKQVKLEQRPRARPSIEISTVEGPKLALIRGVSRGRDSFSPSSSSSLNKYRVCRGYIQCSSLYQAWFACIRTHTRSLQLLRTRTETLGHCRRGTMLYSLDSGGH